MAVFGSSNERATRAEPERNTAPLIDPLNSGFLAPQHPPGTRMPLAPPVPAPKAETPQHKASVLGKTLVFRGELEADEDLILQGRVEGSIRHTRSITIGIDGVVVGDIHAASVTVEGRVEGNLYGTASVLIGASANVQGNVVAPRVGITEGAQFNGSVDMRGIGAAATASPESPVLGDSAVDRMLDTPT
jgi:cytoskeletal protein CcmA (bactofilin family)